MAEKGKFDLQLEVDQKLLDQIEEIGKKEDRTRNGQVIKFLRESVDRYSGLNAHFKGKGEKLTV